MGIIPPMKTLLVTVCLLSCVDFTFAVNAEKVTPQNGVKPLVSFLVRRHMHHRFHHRHRLHHK